MYIVLRPITLLKAIFRKRKLINKYRKEKLKVILLQKKLFECGRAYVQISVCLIWNEKCEITLNFPTLPQMVYIYIIIIFYTRTLHTHVTQSYIHTLRKLPITIRYDRRIYYKHCYENLTFFPCPLSFTLSLSPCFFLLFLYNIRWILLHQ